MRATLTARALCALLVLSPVVAGAQTMSVPAEEALRPRALAIPTLGPEPLSLAEAVRLTVLFNPAVTKATQDIEAALGRHREYRGLFDSTLAVQPRVNYIQQPATPSMIQQQHDNRRVIRQVYDIYSQFTVDLRAMADGLQGRAPTCPVIGGSILPAYTISQGGQATSIYQDQLDDQEISQLGLTTDYNYGSVLQDFSSIAARANFCTLTAPPDPLNEAAAYFGMLDKLKNVDFWGQHTLGTVYESTSYIPREVALDRAQISETVAARAILAWERLGLLPEDELQRQFTFDASYHRPFRNGLVFDVTAQMLSGEQNFKDKPFDPAFGGMGMPTRFKPEVSAGFVLPLARGRGATANAAPERAAAFAVAASREQVRHVTTEEVLRTVLAYSEVVAMQQSLALAEQSAAIVDRVRQLSEQQVNVGDLPAVELDRVRARAATLRALVTETRGRLAEARVGLARGIGLAGSPEIAQLRAADAFVTTAQALPAVDTLVTRALAQRRDVRSLAELVKATDALRLGSRTELRPVLDLSVRGGLSNLYESVQFRYLPDEELDVPLFSCNQNRSNLTPDCVIKPGHSTLTPVRFFDPQGHYRAVAKRWEPFIQAQIRFELPFGNNAARGRVKQADAELRDRRIQATDLERRIAQTLVSTTRALGDASAAMAELTAAVDHGAKVVALAVQQFEARELTLIDVLLTEEQVTQDRIALVRQHQTYVSLLARLRYETGDLLALTGQSGAETLTFQAGDFVAR